MTFNTPVKDVSEEVKLFIYGRNHGRNGGRSSNGNNNNPKISRILHKIYISSRILDLSTETRYVTFVLFYRYIIQYHQHHLNHMGNKIDNKQESKSNTQKHLGKVAVATLFLACKISNENRRIRDVINVYHILRLEYQDDEFENQKEEIIEIESTPPPIDEAYWDFKEEIVRIEQQLLRVLNFDVYDLSISPYRIVVSILEYIINTLENLNEDNKDNCKVVCKETTQQKEVYFKQLLVTTWRHINDGLLEIDLLSMKNSEFACGALQLAIEDTSAETFTTSALIYQITQLNWWEWVDVSFDQLGGAKSQIRKSKEKKSTRSNEKGKRSKNY